MLKFSCDAVNAYKKGEMRVYVCINARDQFKGPDYDGYDY